MHTVHSVRMVNLLTCAVIRQREKAYCQSYQNPRILAREKKFAIARERYYYLSDGEVNEYNIRIVRLTFNIINKI